MKRPTLIHLLATLLLIIPAVSVHATAGPSDSLQTPASKSAGPDTTARPRIPLPGLGSVDRGLSGLPELSDSSMRFDDYQNFADLLLPIGGFFLQDFGSPGEWHQLFYDGLPETSVKFMADGVELNDAFDGLFNIYFLPTEYMERVEVIRGTEAFAYGLNGPGAVVNFLTTSRRAVKPFSRLRYFENAYGQAFVDGMVSEDIMRGLNATAGVSHNTYAGRFENSNYDQWNGRFKMRYNISNALDIGFSENYNQTYLGLFGGINRAVTPDSLLYSQYQAVIANSETYEKVTRHDVAGIIAGRLPGDSSGISTLTVSYSSQLREYRQEPNLNYETQVIHDDQYSRMIGLKLDHQRSLGPGSLVLGAELRTERGNVSLSRTTRSLFGIVHIPLPDSFRLTFSGRFDRADGTDNFGFGPTLRFRPADGLEFFGGYSRSYRFASLEEQSVATDSLFSLLNGAPERHHLVEAGIRLAVPNSLSLELRAYQRTIRNYIAVSPSPTTDNPAALAFVNRDRRLLRGATADLFARCGSFVLEAGAGYLNTVDPADTDVTVPAWNVNGGFYFWDTLLNHRLNLKTGLHVRAFTSYVGRTFLPEYLLYVPGPNDLLLPANTILDFVVVAHLGDAYIHIVIQNLFDTQYVMNSFYPMLDRSLRFGVSWNFLN